MVNEPPAPAPRVAGPVPAPVAAACRSVRPAGPADVVAGVRPSAVARPASTAEASALLRAASGLGLAVVPRGAGTKIGWGSPPARCDLVIDMTGMDQVTEHAAGDLVATVQAGASLEQLAEALGAAGQRLALDPPALPVPGDGRRTRGTVGGVLAAGTAGPLRLRYGAGRDLLIGVTFVLADGTVARSGGKVVKNVAGYDLGKLLAGSRGTLALITEATFRLHPVPAATAHVAAECASAAQACELVAAAQAASISPVAAEIAWAAGPEPVRVAFALEGDPASVAGRARELAARARASGAAEVLAGAAPRWWGAFPWDGPAGGLGAAPGREAGTLVQVAFWPGDLGLVLAEIRATAAGAGAEVAVGGSAGAGILHALVPGRVPPERAAAFVSGLRGALGRALSAPLTAAPEAGQPARGQPADGQPADGLPAHGRAGPACRASAVVLAAPPAVRELVDVFGPVPGLALMRAVKSRFDPGGILSPGRFAGGI